MEHTNELIHSKSAYLLQHAHNPVNWKPWKKEHITKAQEDNKLLLVSIGYSSCHWCHVMEHESFEDEEVASILNKFFVPIKVDREEHPVVDQQYMEVVQAQTGNGGWPLNCICLPDGTPLVAGTYFPKENFMALLLEIAKQYQSQPEALVQHAQNLVKRLQKEKAQKLAAYPQISTLVDGFRKYWDHENGGNKGAPKFLLPINFDFYLDYLNQYHDEEALQYTLHSLEHIACSGLYDQVEGGFTRYATDSAWRVPHFEKMLYDNGQNIATYAKAYRRSEEAGFLRIAEECFRFLKDHFKTATGLFAAATDADSEGREGAYFVIHQEEVDQLTQNTLVAYRIFESFWEDGQYIPQYDTKLFNQSRDISALQPLLEIRKKRVAPFMDTKSIASWNALLLQGFAQLYRSSQKDIHFNAALELHSALNKYHFTSKGDFRIHQEHSYLDATLEDYAQWCKALIEMYWMNWDEQYLHTCLKYIEKIEPYFNPNTGFYLEQNKDSAFSLAKENIHDNVIPSVNSTLAYVLLYLSYAFDRQDYKQRVEDMTARVCNEIDSYYPAYGQWASIILYLHHPNQLVIFDPKDAFQLPMLHPFQIVFKTTQNESGLAVFKDRMQGADLQFFLCKGNQCLLPQNDFENILKDI